MVLLKAKGYFDERPTQKTGNHRRISGQKHNPKSAYEAGYRYATVGPKGNAISFHVVSQNQGTGIYSLRKAGCRIVPLETLL